MYIYNLDNMNMYDIFTGIFYVKNSLCMENCHKQMGLNSQVDENLNYFFHSKSS